MGSPEDEASRGIEEGPQININLAGFWLLDDTITEALFRAVTGRALSSKGWQPATGVSWIDARAFCESVNDLVPGLALQLPSEAQWEYACRAGSLTPFEPTVVHKKRGGSVVDEVNFGCLNRGPVAARKTEPNAWGLKSMHGNVWEWCEDVYSPSHSGADPSGLPRRTQPRYNDFKVVRGGSWIGSERDCRSASRMLYFSGTQSDIIGFRPMQPGAVTVAP